MKQRQEIAELIGIAEKMTVEQAHLCACVYSMGKAIGRGDTSGPDAKWTRTEIADVLECFIEILQNEPKPA